MERGPLHKGELDDGIDDIPDNLLDKDWYWDDRDADRREEEWLLAHPEFRGDHHDEELDET